MNLNLRNMKTINYLYRGFLVFALACFSSCDLTGDLDDETIEYALDAETAIIDESSAELAMAGAYAGLLGQDFSDGMDYLVIPSTLGGFTTPGVFSGLEQASYASNNPVTIDTRHNLNSYTGLYIAINRANWIIEKVGELTDDAFETDGRRSEMIAEAKGIRATAHFYLLRLWGEFYDMNSVYGVPVKTSPVRSAEVLPRSTVAETYAAIISDLDDVIASAPDFAGRIFVSKTYGKGMKAKVLLHQGAYAEAAALAQDVIDNSPTDFVLSPDYASIFDQTSPAIYDNTDIIFGSHLNTNTTSGGGAIWYSWNLYYVVSPASSLLAAESTTIGTQAIQHDSDRISSTQSPGLYGGISNNKLAGFSGFKTINHLRISEVYLIRAEAVARAAGSVTTDALDALNAVRIRAGATTTGADGFETYPASITLDEFLEAVRIEKIMELFGEIGEEWYDIVRYDYIDGFGSGFQASDIKPTATDPGKYILPIDELTIVGGGNVVTQSPGYTN